MYWYLNTPMKETFTTTPSDSFTQTLATVDSDLVESATSKTIKGHIIGAQKSTRSLVCLSCQKNVEVKPGGVLAVCRSCHLTQTESSCPVQWVLRVPIQSSDDPKKPSFLTMSSNLLQCLLPLLSAQVDLATATEENIIIALLSDKKVFNFVFDSKYQISDIQK